MNDLTREAFRAALKREGIAPPPKDFEAAFRTAQFLADSARKVAAFTEGGPDDASR
jgi:uncharacterized protein